VGVQHAIAGRAAADSTVATARSAVAAAQACELATALAWEHERASVAALAQQLAEAELLLGVSPPVVADADSSPNYEASIIANLHAQATGVQNIRSLVSVVLDANSSAYARWRDLVLLTPQRYALDDHVLTDRTPTMPSWFRMDSIVPS